MSGSSIFGIFNVLAIFTNFEVFYLDPVFLQFFLESAISTYFEVLSPDQVFWDLFSLWIFLLLLEFVEILSIWKSYVWIKYFWNVILANGMKVNKFELAPF